MSAPEPDDHVELRLAGRDEFWRPVFTLTAVMGDSRVMVWDGTNLDEARTAAQFWENDGVEVVDLVPSGVTQ